MPEPIAIEYTLNTPGITDVDGFACAGVACDIRGKGDNRLDLSLIHSSRPCNAAGVFTQNDLKSASVQVSSEHLKHGKAWHTIVANSGNANTFTGQAGCDDAKTIAQTAADLLGLPKESVLLGSTGIIGIKLPMDAIRVGIQQAVKTKSTEAQASRQAVEAILTSDTCPKSLTARFSWEGQTVTLGAIAKGGGMIQPNMATVLAFIVTDAQIASPLLQGMLNTAVDQSFNRISVDGDMSTNDSVLTLANGSSQVTIPEDPTSPLHQNFSEALNTVCHLLAEKIIGDDTRMTKVVEVNIRNAPSDAAAEKMARALAHSPLVKSSWYGNDPNWGRLVDAAGYAGICLQESQLDLSYHSRSLHPALAEHETAETLEPVSTKVLVKGQAQWDNQSVWKAIVSRPQFGISFDLHLGSGSFSMLTTDLSEAYIRSLAKG